MKLSSFTIVQCLAIGLVYGRVVNHFPLRTLRDGGIDNVSSNPAPAPAPLSVPLLPASPAPIQNNIAASSFAADSQAAQAPAPQPVSIPAPPTPMQALAPAQAPPPVQAPAPVAPLSVPGQANRPPGTIDPTLIPVGASLNMLPPEFVNWLITASQIRPPGDSINPANVLQAPASNSPGNPQLFPLLPAGVTPGTPGVPTANAPANPVDMLHGAATQLTNPTGNNNPTPTNANAPSATYNGDNSSTPTDSNSDSQRDHSQGNNTQVDGTDNGSNDTSSSSSSRSKSGGTQTTSNSIKLKPKEMGISLLLGFILSQLV